MGVVLAALALALGVGATVAATGTGTTLRGHVLLQPVEPQCGKGTCSTPARGLTLHLRPRSGHMRTVHTNARGDFRVVVPAGFYTVSTPLTESSAEAKITPRRIWLHPHQDVRLVFAYRPGR
jgi:hypothetical protein